MNRNYLAGEKVQVSCSLEVLGSRTRILKGPKRKENSRREGGVSDLGIRRAWGDEHFGISGGKGGLKYSCSPW